MDLKELIKFQMVQAMGTNRHGGNFKSQVMMVLFMSCIEEFMKVVAYVVQYCKDGYSAKINRAVTAIKPNLMLTDDSIQLDKRHFINSVTMRRQWLDKKDRCEAFQETNELTDSILLFVARLNNIPSLQFIEHARTVVNYIDKPIQVTRDIYMKITNIATGTGGEIVDVQFNLMSNQLCAADITKWARSIHELYREEMKNALGDSIYFFDQKSKNGGDHRNMVNATDTEKDIEYKKAMVLMSEPKNLSYVKMPFYSNKQFRNIFGEEVRLVEKRVKFFMEHPEWYDQRGIPYQLGIMLSGLPGSGKTSIIRAVANYTRRHIINVNFANIKTVTQLKNLFFSEKISVYNDETMANSTLIHIPINQRIYVLEEIDAISDIVKQRTDGDAEKKPLHDELTLGEILQVLDGTLESPGRMIIVTSNHPEVLDRALIRPGRIDVNVKFGNASVSLIVEMFEAFFSEKFPEHLKKHIPSNTKTPAEVSQVMFNFLNSEEKVNVEELLRELSHGTPLAFEETPPISETPAPFDNHRPLAPVFPREPKNLLHGDSSSEDDDGPNELLPDKTAPKNADKFFDQNSSFTDEEFNEFCAKLVHMSQNTHMNGYDESCLKRLARWALKGPEVFRKEIAQNQMSKFPTTIRPTPLTTMKRRVEEMDEIEANDVIKGFEGFGGFGGYGAAFIDLEAEEEVMF